MCSSTFVFDLLKAGKEPSCSRREVMDVRSIFLCLTLGISGCLIWLSKSPGSFCFYPTGWQIALKELLAIPYGSKTQKWPKVIP